MFILPGSLPGIGKKRDRDSGLPNPGQHVVPSWQLRLGVSGASAGTEAAFQNKKHSGKSQPGYSGLCILLCGLPTLARLPHLPLASLRLETRDCLIPSAKAFVILKCPGEDEALRWPKSKWGG